MTYTNKGNIGAGRALFPPTDHKAPFSLVLALAATTKYTSATTTLNTNFGHIYYLLFSYLSFVVFTSSPSSFDFVSCLLSLRNRQSLALYDNIRQWCSSSTVQPSVFWQLHLWTSILKQKKNNTVVVFWKCTSAYKHPLWKQDTILYDLIITYKTRSQALSRRYLSTST